MIKNTLTVGQKVVVHYFDVDGDCGDIADDYIGIVTDVCENQVVVKYMVETNFNEDGSQDYEERVKTFKYYPPTDYYDGEWLADGDIKLLQYFERF